MATRYIASESTDLIRGLEQNLQDAKRVFESLKSATATLNEALSNGELKGKTYDSANTYFTGVLLPMMENGQQIVTEAFSDLEKYKYENSKIQHYGSIHTKSLLKMRDIIREQDRASRQSLDCFLEMVKHHPFLQKLIDVAEENIRYSSKQLKRIDEKLQAIENFENNTRNLFEYSMINLKNFSKAIENLKDVKIVEGEVQFSKDVYTNIKAMKDKRLAYEQAQWQKEYETWSGASELLKGGKQGSKAIKEL